MSVMCCVYVPEGIILAADSRLTQSKLFYGPGEQGNIAIKETVYTLSDNAQKVFFVKKNNVGISFCGDAFINGMTVADYIRKFEIEKIHNTDSTKTTAEKLSECDIGSRTTFFVCGFDTDVPYVYSVYGKEIKRLNVLSNQALNTMPVVDACDDANNLELGKPAVINSEKQDRKEENIKSQEERILYGAHWSGKQIAITKLVNDQPALVTSYNMMPLKDAIDFAEFLVDLTIKYERFSDDIQTCGGDIDVLVITKDNAFWKQHKVYNPKK